MREAMPGARVDNGTLAVDIDFSSLALIISADRYRTQEFQELERERLWMRVWQVAGRADDLPEAGEWMVYSILDQSYVLVRGKDGIIRGFVNACRHRGNAFCHGKGRSARFTCPYHNWSYGLDGQLLAVAKPDFGGSVEEFIGPKEKFSLLQVSVECFAGFIFVNPDPDAAPLAQFLGEAGEILAAYHIEEMIPVAMNVRESIHSNWKVVMDAFHEGYHLQAVHPELIAMVDLSKERFSDVGMHCATTVPFGGPHRANVSLEEEIALIRNLPAANFPGLAEVLPRFDELVREHTRADGSLALAEGVTARMLFQRAARESLTSKGLDVSALTDKQMSDYQFWALFPNVYMQIRPGEAVVIIALPDADGDPNRCKWQVTSYLWVPPEERLTRREPLEEVLEGEHYPYFLALEQDYQQMQNQQGGLRNTALKAIYPTRQEPKVAHFHATLDRWLDGYGARPSVPVN